VTETQLTDLSRALERLRPALATIDDWARRLAGSLPDGGRLLVAGNGGSAAEAQHLTGELVGRYVHDRVPLSAIALHADTSALTAIGNDYGPDELFARQVRAHGRRGDVVMLLSTSGTSANVVQAAKAAHEIGAVAWALTGPAPNLLASVCDDAIAVDAARVSTVQEAHLVLVHALCEALDGHLGIGGEPR
jgi:D-sedoheptulose 7-phosphate isomerase